MLPASVTSLRPPPDCPVDLEVLQRFEAGLDPRYPERNVIPGRVLGYGEISTVFEIQVPELADLAFKRLPIFYTAAEMARYAVVYEEYNRLLGDEIGLALPLQGYAAFLDRQGQPIFYIIQKRLPPEAIGNRAIHHLSQAEIVALVRRVLAELLKVWRFNARHDHIQVGIDGQISNWVLTGGPAAPFLYIDTSTPLYRVASVEQLDTELFLRSAPSFLRWLLRLLFVGDVVNRYYDLRLVTIDLIANFYKEGLPGCVPDLASAANTLLAGQTDLPALAPITEAEIRAYYRDDATIWRSYQAARKLDRFLQTRLLRRRYPYILPGAIRR